MRSVGAIGSITESTYKNDIEHGLERKIMRHEILIRLWDRGQCVAGFQFDEKFRERERYDTEQ